NSDSRTTFFQMNPLPRDTIIAETLYRQGVVAAELNEEELKHLLKEIFLCSAAQAKKAYRRMVLGPQPQLPQQHYHQPQHHHEQQQQVNNMRPALQRKVFRGFEGLMRLEALAANSSATPRARNDPPPPLFSPKQACLTLFYHHQHDLHHHNRPNHYY
ncbi:hypothetical protein HDU98_004531, partial [Podochytrium sp. JEL0797]